MVPVVRKTAAAPSSDDTGGYMKRTLLWLALAGALSAATVVWLVSAAPAGAARAATQVPLGGTGSPQTGDFTAWSGEATQDEFPSGEDTEQGPDPYNGTI